MWSPRSERDGGDRELGIWERRERWRGSEREREREGGKEEGGGGGE